MKYLKKLSLLPILLGAATISAAPAPAANPVILTVRETCTTNFNSTKARAAVLEAFQHSWSGYVANAWAADEVNPTNGDPSYSRYV